MCLSTWSAMTAASVSPGGLDEVGTPRAKRRLGRQPSNEAMVSPATAVLEDRVEVREAGRSATLAVKPPSGAPG